MNFFRKIYKIKFGLTLLCMLTLISGCKDDIYLDNEVNGPDEEQIEGYSLGFLVQLDRDISSRSSRAGNFSDVDEDYDDWIDTQDKFRVFFFTKEGQFLFGANDRVVGSKYEAYDQAYWYVRIPMTMLVDRQNHEYDIDLIKRFLKNNDFKVAVLANWPNNGARINPGDYDDSDSNTGALNPSSTLKGEPLWGWKNSVLYNYKYTKASPEEQQKMLEDVGEPDVKNINDLHHLYNEINGYASPENSSVYYPFFGTVKDSDDPSVTYNAMGEPTDWVKMREISEGWKAPYGLNSKVYPEIVSSIEGKTSSFDSKATANQWIRANWSPDMDLNEGKLIYRHYQHLWYLWNFNASYKTGAKPNNVTYSNDKVASVADASEYESNFGWNDATPEHRVTWTVNPWGEEWYKRNGDDIYQWMKKSMTETDQGTTYSDLGELKTLSTDTRLGIPQNILTYTPMSEAHMMQNSEGNYGIYLPANGAGQRASDATPGCFRFRARTSGIIRVRWSSAGNASATLAIQRDQPSGSRYRTTTYTASGDKAVNTAEWEINVNDDAFPMYVYCSQGNAIIYSIEYIRGKYLYETDRENVAPNREQGIPMYGVQEFEKIPNWEYGTTHNLSDGDNGKNVYLIRALAKVEVYIPIHFGVKPAHVYMINMNRAARCEPMDVETPTDLLWNNRVEETPYSHSHDNTHCEWFNLQKYDPAYSVGTNSPADYTRYLSWYFGSWKNAKWKNVRYTVDQNDVWHFGYSEGWGFKSFTVKNEDEQHKYPHIFNSYIDRADFCRFLDAGTDEGGQYYKFVLYMPEKNIDDPTTVGDATSAPKVPHIEYRFPPKAANASRAPQEAAENYNNTEFNLDDTDCYHIYFTNYGTDAKWGPANSVITSTKNGYDTYEKNVENLRKHWPIMRNHLYQFYIGGSGPENMDVHVRVKQWGFNKVVVEW